MWHPTQSPEFQRSRIVVSRDATVAGQHQQHGRRRTGRAGRAPPQAPTLLLLRHGDREKNPAHFNALTYDFSAARRRLYEQSANPWEGDNTTLKSGLIRMAQKWCQIAASADPCPVSFTADEERECLRLEEEQREGDAQMTASKEILGIGPEGWVPSEHYPEVKAAIATMKADVISGAESETDRDRIREHWVYDDIDEDEYL